MNLQKTLLVLAAVAGLIACWGCGRTPEAPQKEKPPAPAKVENGGVKEADLATITPTPKAETRLGIRTAAVEYGPAPRSETLAGEVIIPPGQSLLVTAPVAGTIGLADKADPAPGTPVGKGQPLFRLLPLLPIVVGGDIPGHEIEHPMAAVILGGLLTSTVLNLFLMPALYCRFAKSRAQVAAEERPDLSRQ